MLLFRMYTLKFEFDRHLENMVSYQGMQSGLPVFLVAEFDALEIFVQNDWLGKPDFHISGKVKNKSHLDGI